MITQEEIEQLKPFQARAIIEALRKGLVPTEYVPFFTVGRQEWLRFVEEDLDHFIAEGGGKVRFVNGDYGDGKTHFMSVIQQLALQKHFAASFVVLDRDVPIHKFEVVYQEIVARLRGSFPGVGISALLQSWIQEKRAAEIEVAALSEELSREATMDGNFIHALVGLLQIATTPSAYTAEEGQVEAQEMLYQWFEGKKVPKKALAPFRIFESLNKTNSRSFLRSLVGFLKCAGHKGLVLLFDELETVLAQGASVRNATYETIRLLMDSTEHMEHLELFFSLIPDVLLSERGFKSYDALWSRVRTVGETGDTGVLNYRSTLIDLHRTPLKRQEFIRLGVLLRRIHEISYRWSGEGVVSDGVIAEMCARQEEMGVLSEVRLFIRQMIRCLDMAEQGNSLDELDLRENLLMSQIENIQEKFAPLEPAWDA